MTESLTRTVKRYGAAVDAADVAVPLITPPSVNDKTGGRDPLKIDHLYGGVPPVAASVAE